MFAPGIAHPTKAGPVAYQHPSFEALLVTGGTTVNHTFQFPRAVFVTGIQLLPIDGAYTTLVRFGISIVDETQNEVIYNWRGGREIGALALQGRNGIGGPGPLFALGGYRSFFRLQRPVLDGDRWRFSVSLDAGADATIAALGIIFEEGLRRG